MFCSQPSPGDYDRNYDSIPSRPWLGRTPNSSWSQRTFSKTFALPKYKMTMGRGGSSTSMGLAPMSGQDMPAGRSSQEHSKNMQVSSESKRGEEPSLSKGLKGKFSPEKAKGLRNPSPADSQRSVQDDAVIKPRAPTFMNRFGGAENQTKSVLLDDEKRALMDIGNKTKEIIQGECRTIEELKRTKSEVETVKDLVQGFRNDVESVFLALEGAFNDLRQEQVESKFQHIVGLESDNVNPYRGLQEAMATQLRETNENLHSRIEKEAVETRTQLKEAFERLGQLTSDVKETLKEKANSDSSERDVEKKKSAQDHNKGPSKAKNDGRNGAATAKNVGVQHRVTTRSAIMTRQKRKAAAQPIPCYFRSAKARKPQETSKEKRNKSNSERISDKEIFSTYPTTATTTPSLARENQTPPRRLAKSNCAPSHEDCDVESFVQFDSSDEDVPFDNSPKYTTRRSLWRRVAKA